MSAQPLARETGVAELRHGQYAVLSLRMHQFDLERVQSLLAEQVAAAPQLLTGAAIVLELDALDPLPDAEALQQLLNVVRLCGLRCVAVAADLDSPAAQRADAVQLPCVAPSRRGLRAVSSDALVPSGNEVEAAPGSGATDPPDVLAECPSASSQAALSAVAGMAPVMRIDQPVRSGQQMYARGSDLIVSATVSAGAEVVADGDVHIYGRLSGKALAGARGDTTARIYCLAFDAELVSIAGHFRVFERVPPELKGKPCQLFLQGDRLDIQPLL